MGWRPSRLEERQLAILWGASAAAVFLLRGSLAKVSFAAECPMKLAAGVACPTCGSTRTVLAFLEGRVSEAFALNPLIAAGIAVFFVGGVLAPGWAVLRRPLPDRPIPTPVAWRLSLVAIIVLNWSYLIVTGI